MQRAYLQNLAFRTREAPRRITAMFSWTTALTALRVTVH